MNPDQIGAKLSFIVAAAVAIYGGAPLFSAHAQDIDQYLPKANAPCAGELEKRHSNAYPWDFTTNSQKPNSRQPTLYLHCVFNNSADYVDIDWKIPQVTGAIAGKQSLISPRYSEKSPLSSAEGCLVYGNLHDKALRAQFWARPEDKEPLNEEIGKDCLKLKVSSTRSEPARKKELRESVAPFRFFLPFDTSFPEKGLVAFEGITGVRAIKDRGYETFITYRLRADSSQAVATVASEVAFRYVIEPRWTSASKALEPVFTKLNGSYLKLVADKSSTTINLPTYGSEWNLTELEFQVIEIKSKRVAARLFAPVYVPQ